MGRIELYCHAEPLVQGYAAMKPLHVYARFVEPCPGSLMTFVDALSSKAG